MSEPIKVGDYVQYASLVRRVTVVDPHCPKLRGQRVGLEDAGWVWVADTPSEQGMGARRVPAPARRNEASL